MALDPDHLAAARERLRLLSAEFGAPDVGPAPPEPVLVAPPGRHARAADQLSDWVHDRLPTLVRGRFTLTRAHVGWVIAVAAVAVVLTGWYVVRANAIGAGQPVPTARVVAGPTPSATASPAMIVVDVAGKVRRPGLVSLPAGARVFDAIKGAGGLRRGVHSAGINLARPLIDGEQVLVAGGSAVAVASSGPVGSGGAGPGTSLVNLNTAGLAELDTLPGVGPVTAQKILDWRSANGSFTAIDELLEVDGIGDKTLADIAPHVTV